MTRFNPALEAAFLAATAHATEPEAALLRARIWEELDGFYVIGEALHLSLRDRARQLEAK